MKLLMYMSLTLAVIALAAFAETPKIENKDWETACGGSNITVTSVAGKIVTVDAFVEHFAEGRHWQCHFKDGKIISAVYRHFTVTRKAAGDAGEFKTELVEDRVEAFHFPDHKVGEIDPILRADLLKVMAIANNKSQQVSDSKRD